MENSYEFDIEIHNGNHDQLRMSVLQICAFFEVTSVVSDIHNGRRPGFLFQIDFDVSVGYSLSTLVIL